jgi:DNA gyrase subunit A
VGARKVKETHQVTISTDRGQNIRMKISDISILGRNTQGVRLINLDDKEEKVTGLATVEDEAEVAGSDEAPTDLH